MAAKLTAAQQAALDAANKIAGQNTATTNALEAFMSGYDSLTQSSQDLQASTVATQQAAQTAQVAAKAATTSSNTNTLVIVIAAVIALVFFLE